MFLGHLPTKSVCVNLIIAVLMRTLETTKPALPALGARSDSQFSFLRGATHSKLFSTRRVVRTGCMFLSIYRFAYYCHKASAEYTLIALLGPLENIQHLLLV